jgi:hypothetical protein
MLVSCARDLEALPSRQRHWEECCHHVEASCSPAQQAGSAHPIPAGHRGHRPRRRVGHPPRQQHPVTLNLNPAGLARFTDWVTTLPPRPLPRTVTPVASEYHLDYIARLADANHLGFLELTAALDDTAAITLHGPRDWTQHEQERLAAAAGQPLARIARLYWSDPRHCLRDREGFRQTLRPACRRWTARYGIPGPSPATCRRTRPSAAATGSGPTPPPAATPASSMSASSPRSSVPSAATAISPRPIIRGDWGTRSVTPGRPSTGPSAPTAGRCRSGTGRVSSTPASGISPCPACSASALAGQTTDPATPSSRSRSTPTSPGSSQTTSGRTMPATEPRCDMPTDGLPMLALMVLPVK